MWAQQPATALITKNLEIWEARGDAFWSVLKDNVLAGQRRPPAVRKKESDADYKGWMNQQAWLYTKEEFENFDLHLEFFVPIGTNSGIALLDPSRGQYGLSIPPDYTKTPSKIAYEIQINNQYPDPHPTGSIYGLMDAPKDLQNDYDWNSMDITVADGKVTVKVNGKPAAEAAQPSARPKKGPIGLQLHDQKTIVMFRNITIQRR